MGEVSKVLLLAWILMVRRIVLASSSSSDSTAQPSTQGEGSHPIHSSAACYGERLRAVCGPGYAVRVVSGLYRQLPSCPGGFHSNFCSKEEYSNPSCVGNTTCQFDTPWLFLSKECGYSNNFLLTYQCIPASGQIDVCSEAAPILSTQQSGYLVSPRYPKKYPVRRTCELALVPPPGAVLSLYLLDLYLAYYDYEAEEGGANSKHCIDKLWLSTASEDSEVMCTAKKRGLLVSTNLTTTVHFTSDTHDFRNAKGFWIYYEFSPAPSMEESISYNIDPPPPHHHPPQTQSSPSSPPSLLSMLSRSLSPPKTSNSFQSLASYPPSSRSPSSPHPTFASYLPSYKTTANPPLSETPAIQTSKRNQQVKPSMNYNANSYSNTYGTNDASGHQLNTQTHNLNVHSKTLPTSEDISNFNVQSPSAYQTPYSSYTSNSWSDYPPNTHVHATRANDIQPPGSRSNTPTHAQQHHSRSSGQNKHPAMPLSAYTDGGVDGSRGVDNGLSTNEIIMASSSSGHTDLSLPRGSSGLDRNTRDQSTGKLSPGSATKDSHLQDLHKVNYEATQGNGERTLSDPENKMGPISTNSAVTDNIFTNPDTDANANANNLKSGANRKESTKVIPTHPSPSETQQVLDREQVKRNEKAWFNLLRARFLQHQDQQQLLQLPQQHQQQQQEEDEQDEERSLHHPQPVAAAASPIMIPSSHRPPPSGAITGHHQLPSPPNNTRINGGQHHFTMDKVENKDGDYVNSNDNTNYATENSNGNNGNYGINYPETDDVQLNADLNEDNEEEEEAEEAVNLKLEQVIQIVESRRNSQNAVDTGIILPVGGGGMHGFPTAWNPPPHAIIRLSHPATTTTTTPQPTTETTLETTTMTNKPTPAVSSTPDPITVTHWYPTTPKPPEHPSLLIQQVPKETIFVKEEDTTTSKDKSIDTKGNESNDNDNDNDTDNDSNDAARSVNHHKELLHNLSQLLKKSYSSSSNVYDEPTPAEIAPTSPSSPRQHNTIVGTTHSPWQMQVMDNFGYLLIASAGVLTVLTLVIIGLVLHRKRRDRVLRRHIQKIGLNKAYEDVILAYDQGRPCTGASPGMNHTIFGNPADSPCGGSLAGGLSASSTEELIGRGIPWQMATIDERPEDIYTQVKRTPHHPLHHRAHRSKVHFTDKHKSKSLTDLEAWETVMGLQQRKANTVDNLASLNSLHDPNGQDNHAPLSPGDEASYRAQMERMYAEVALAYMRANMYGGQHQPQPPELDDYLRARFADLVAAGGNEEGDRGRGEGSIEDGGEDRVHQSSNTERQPMYQHASTSQTWRHVLERQSSTDHQDDDACLQDERRRAAVAAAGTQSLMDFGSSTHSSNATLTSGLEQHLHQNSNAAQPSSSASEGCPDEEEASPYDTYIDEYRPYQIPGPPPPAPPPPVQTARGYTSMFRPAPTEASKQSSMRSYESIRSEHMMSGQQTPISVISSRGGNRQDMGFPQDVPL